MINKEMLDKIEAEIDALLDAETEEGLLDWLNNRRSKHSSNTNVLRSSLPQLECNMCGSKNVKPAMQLGKFYCGDCQCTVD